MTETETEQGCFVCIQQASLPICLFDAAEMRLSLTSTNSLSTRSLLASASSELTVPRQSPRYVHATSTLSSRAASPHTRPD